MDERIMKKLYETFRLSTRQGQGGMTFKYVPNEDVINRMNEVFKGNWSTTIKDKDVVDDQVVVEVEVSVFDPDGGIKYSHTGFGSQQIMRYNSGPNQGKIIDIGNAYKGALAKSIVNACTRWGVGLFKERNPYGMDNITMVAESQEDSAKVPVMAPPVAPAAAPPAPASNIPVQPTPQPAQVAQPVPVAQAAPVPPAAPVAPVVSAPASVPVPEMSTQPVVETMATFPPPASANQTVQAEVSVVQEPAPVEMPKIPTPNMASQPQTAPAAVPVQELPSSSNEGLAGVGISDVQRVALNGILSMNSANYNELAQEAFAANNINKAIPNKEDLSYDEAVVVIKYGNDKYRKTK